MSFFVQKWQKSPIFIILKKAFLYAVLLYAVVIWCKCQLILSNIEGADAFGVKVLKMSILTVKRGPTKIETFKMQ